MKPIAPMLIIVLSGSLPLPVYAEATESHARPFAASFAAQNQTWQSAVAIHATRSHCFVQACGMGGMFGSGQSSTPAKRSVKEELWLFRYDDSTLVPIVLVLVTLVPLSLICFWFVKRQRTIDPYRCASCDYNLAGTVAANRFFCPECGTIIESPLSHGRP